MTIKNLYPTVRPSLDLNFANTKRLDPRITFSRASTGTFVDSDGLIKTAASELPRFDHSPSTGESLGLLVEEARTNLLTYSEQFDNAAWTKSNITVSANAAIAPNGTTTADLVYPDSTGTNRSLYRATTGTNGALYTSSIFLKANGIRYACVSSVRGISSRAAWFDLQNGTVGTINGGVTATIQNHGSGWYRCSVTDTSNSTTIYFGDVILTSADNSTSVTANGTDGIYHWGAQLEAGAFPTSYIPTPATFSSRTSTATFYDSAGTVQTAASGVARSNAFFPDNSGVMRSAGLLLEAAATNLIVGSQTFNTGGWSVDGISITNNAAVAPDGTTTAASIVQGTGGNRTFHFDNNGPGNKTFTIFAKSNTGSSFQLTGGMNYGTNLVTTATLNTANGTISGATGCSSQQLANGWYRFILPVFVGTGSGNTNYYTINGPSSSVYIWGAQVETSPYATSYIPTVASTVTRSADVSTSATVTRSADVASITGANLSSWYNQSKGTILHSGRFIGDVQTSTYGRINGLVFRFGNDTVSAFSYQWYAGGWRASGPGFPPWLEHGIYNGTNTYGTNSYPTLFNNPVGKKMNLAFFVDEENNLIGAAADGEAVATVSFVPAPLSWNTLSFTTAYDGSTRCGHISRFVYYPTRLSDAIIQSLTR